MASTAFEDSADYVQSLARGLQVLRAFDRELPSASLSEVAERTDLSRAVVRRSLLTLQHLGYVGSRGRSFFLTPRVLELGYSYLTSLDLTGLAQQSMDQLAQRVSESCSLAVLDGTDIVYVLRVPVRRVMSLTLGVGTRLPAYGTSMGRVLLAQLPPAALEHYLATARLVARTGHTSVSPARLRKILAETRAQGYAMIDQELEVGLRSIAVPIRDLRGQVVASINVGAHAARVSLDEMRERFLPALQHCAAELGQLLV